MIPKVRKGMKLASDIEAVGFEEAVHTPDDIHCLCSIDVDNEELYLFHDYKGFCGEIVLDPYDDKEYEIPEKTGTLAEGLQFWERATQEGGKLIIHNARTYDEIIINKVWPDNSIPSDAYVDTLILSKKQWFERPTPKGAKGAHGLAAWALRMGIHKPEITDWKTMDALKLHRVIEDVKAQAYCYKQLVKERRALTKLGVTFGKSDTIENKYATACFHQEKRGAMVDKRHVLSCLEDLDSKIDALTKEVEPNLPPNVKIVSNGSKLSPKEIAEVLGKDPARCKDKLIKKKVNGEVVDCVEKPYYSPVTLTHVKNKVKVYKAFHKGMGVWSPAFEKKKGYTDWRNSHYAKTKPKEWDVMVEEKVFLKLKPNVAAWFDVDEEDHGYVGGPYTKVEILETRLTQSDLVKQYLVELGIKHFEEWNLAKDVYGNFIKCDNKTTVVWPEKARKENQVTVEIEKGGYLYSTPKLSEKDYDQLPEGLGKKIAEYNTYNHRRRFLSNPKDPEEKGLLSFIREDGRVPCGVNNFNTRSGRSSMRVWVNAPGEGALYGEEIRRTIIAKPGHKLVGVDMASAQLRIAAYVSCNYEYYQTVASGKELDDNDNYLGGSAHCFHARAFNLVSEEEWKAAIGLHCEDPAVKNISKRRKKSKGLSFASLFGCSDSKLAKMADVPKSEGKVMKESFLKRMGLDGCIDFLKGCESRYKYKRGFYLPVAMGYWLWCDSSHKSVNTVIQGMEAVAQKMAVLKAEMVLRNKGIDNVAYKVLDYSDEMLFEVREDLTDKVGKIICDAYDWAADQLYKYHVDNPDEFPNINHVAFPITLSGGYKVGDNYMDVH